MSKRQVKAKFTLSQYRLLHDCGLEQLSESLSLHPSLHPSLSFILSGLSPSQLERQIQSVCVMTSICQQACIILTRPINTFVSPTQQTVYCYVASHFLALAIQFWAEHVVVQCIRSVLTFWAVYIVLRSTVSVVVMAACCWKRPSTCGSRDGWLVVGAVRDGSHLAAQFKCSPRSRRHSVETLHDSNRRHYIKRNRCNDRTVLYLSQLSRSTLPHFAGLQPPG